VTLRRLDALYALEGIAFGLLMPFPVPLLVERGLGAAEIGLILGIAGLAALLAYPVWGVIADGWLGRPRTIALSALTAAAGGIWILLSGSDPVALTAALSVAMVGTLAWGPLIDALTLGLLGDSSASYGRIRVWASLGWAVSATLGGAVWVLAGSDPVFAAFVVAAFALAVLVVRPSQAVVAPGASAEDEIVSRPPLRAWLPVFVAPVLLGFLVGLLITSIGEHASWRFIGLRILDQGGGVFLIGLTAALPALVEIPVFSSSRRLAARLGLRWLFVSGAIVAAVLMALVAVAPEPWMITGLRTLDGVSFALRYMAMVMIIGAMLPRHLYAMGQSVAWLVYAGIAPIVADVAGGLIYDVYGAPVLFMLATAALAIGGGIVWLALRGPDFGPQRPVSLPEEVSVSPPVAPQPP
jgi:PPP family 3-phenylpropionic acid transporter